jgi:poly-gamma-glutamate synthase PgsB/CapB
MIGLVLISAILILYFIYEYVKHVRILNAIPIRVHVNGTRGKSSVTRLIAAGLRAGGYTVVAKTTGTMPRVILPDGSESEIIRIQGANIIEQKYVVRFAGIYKPNALVMECMALNPVFQWLTERLFVQSTINVITNTRLDHMDVMGPNLETITMSISNTIPENGICYTAEDSMYPLLEKIASARNTAIHKVRPNDVTDEEMEKFKYIEHKDNLQLALAVCQHVGISREVALNSMIAARPDPGALRKFIIRDREKKIIFYNVFAANDPNSTEYTYNMITDKLPQRTTKMVLLSCREDRYYRSQQLVEVCVRIDVDYILLVGGVTNKLVDYALNLGINKDKIIYLGEVDPISIHRTAFALAGDEAYVIGIGNMAGEGNYGAQIVKYYMKIMNSLILN